MQSKETNFLVLGRNSQIIVAKTQTSVRVVAILPDNLAICQQIYTQPPLPQTSTGIAFKKMDELYHFLANARTMPDRWLMTDAATLQVTTQTDTLKLALKAVTDPLEMLRVAVLRASVNGGGDSKQQDLSGIQQQLSSLRSGYNSIGTKMNRMGEVYEQLQKSNDKNTQMLSAYTQRLDLCEQTTQDLQTKIQKNQQKNQAQFDQMKSSIDIVAKTMHRNLLTLKQATDKCFEQVNAEIACIKAEIDSYDFMKIRRDSEQILRLFELEIKIKDYQFIPEEALLSLNRKLHWLNKRTLKNLEDVRDYNKVAGEHPFPPGISKFRIIVHSIKNNGLLMGVCSKKLKENFGSAAFNDQSMITLNSCGYVTNRGAMLITSAKVKPGDTLKMVVNLSQGLISWFCNDIGVAMADMGPLNKEQVYPVIGLGHFGDEIQILQFEPPKKTVDVVHETYAKELQRMNEKFGNRYRQ